MSGQKQSSKGGAERRTGAGHRVHFEALVAVGAAEGGAGFEAESVDVSAEGMRLRTAYLPQVGERLVCRFDGVDGELIVEGEVMWATEQTKGGEFALRFIDIDADTKEMLKELCFAEEHEAEGDDPADKSLAGTRVRLHIEGLGSPMKARVRSGNERELQVGSSLEFLKLGRTVELEDVDRQKKREGFVDTVKVEIDPESSVPQLVVSLRFDGVGAAIASITPKKDAVAKKDPAPTKREEAPKTKPGIGPQTIAAAPLEESAAPGTVRALDNDLTEEELEFGKSKLRVAGDKAKAITSQAARKIGPTLSTLGAGARGVWDKVQGGIARRRDKNEATARENAPKRVTALPPSGALKSSGRKLVREDNNEMEPESMEIPKNSKKRALVGAVVGLGLVAGVFGVVKAASSSDVPAKKPAAHAEADAKSPVPGIPGAPAMGNVPMLGATPLSTTEQVETPSPAASAAASAASASKAPGGDDGDEEKPASTETVKEWGHGNVSKPHILHVKMDGEVAGITGEETDGGFVLHVPGHKSVSSNSGLARKDKRLASVDVVNHDDETEITVKFKGDAPGYLAKVKGNKIEIEISAEGSKVADAKPGKKKKSTKKHH